MRSPMIEQIEKLRPDPHRQCYTDLMVCHSSAGFYVGTMAHIVWHDKETRKRHDYHEPGTRDSPCYFETEEEAQAWLDALTEDNKAAMCRDHL